MSVYFATFPEISITCLCMYMYVCIYICMYMIVYIYIYIYIYMCMWYVCVCVCTMVYWFLAWTLCHWEDFGSYKKVRINRKMMHQNLIQLKYGAFDIKNVMERKRSKSDLCTLNSSIATNVFLSLKRPAKESIICNGGYINKIIKFKR